MRSGMIRKAGRAVVTLALLGGAVLAAWAAVRHGAVVLPFSNPVAFCGKGDALYVVEGARNRILELDSFAPGKPLRLKSATRIEPDEASFYYTVRRVFPGPAGVVVQSYVYDTQTQAFRGYRFREYVDFAAPAREILRIHLPDPGAFPEVTYDFDRSGNHWFANNIQGQRNIWKVPAEGGAVVTGGIVPSAVQEMGETNNVLTSWSSICVGPDGSVYLGSRADGLVIQYSADGERLRDIGTVGFGHGDILAPEDVFFMPGAADEPSPLTVAASGNRSWVQFDAAGGPPREIAPLRGGYPFRDLLVGRIYAHSSRRLHYTFDLANKAFVLIGADGFPVVTTYRAREPRKAGLYGGAAVLLLLLGVTRRRWARLLGGIRYPACAKLLLVFLPLLLASALLVGDQVRATMQESLHEQFLRRSANLAWAIVHSVPLADLEAVQKPQDRNGPAYERIFTTVSRILDAERVPGTPKWILHKIRDGKYYFGINVWRGAIYEPYIVTPDRPMFFDALREKTCQWGRFIDDQGEWFSYLCPILDGQGNVPYVLELYRPTQELDRARRAATTRIWKTVVATLVVAVLLVVIFAFFFTRPLRELARGAAIFSTGNFEHRIQVRARDEMGQLAAAFNRMVVDLKQYTVDLARTTAEKERFENELKFAHEIQQGALPRVFPPFASAENVEIRARIAPAREIGGDYYDFFLVDEGLLGVTIADVSGKGMAAGLFLMEVRSELRNAAVLERSTGKVLQKTNAVLAADNPACMFATLFYFLCDLAAGEILYSSAGHPPPILVRGGAAKFLECDHAHGSGMVLGAMEDAVYGECRLPLEDGDALVLYTDGVTEAVNGAGVMYETERLLACVNSHANAAAAEICAAVYDDVAEFQKGLEQFDDITILVFKYQGRRMTGGA